MHAYLLVTTTLETEADAKRLAKQLVEQQLAACVHVSGPVTSYYRWQGKIEQADEWTCTIKTKVAVFERLSRAISSIHPYDVPEIVATPISDASASYAAWLDDQIH